MADDLNKHTVKELKSMAKERGLKGYSSLKKAELIALLGDVKISKEPQNEDAVGRLIDKLPDENTEIRGQHVIGFFAILLPVFALMAWCGGGEETESKTEQEMVAQTNQSKAETKAGDNLESLRAEITSTAGEDRLVAVANYFQKLPKRGTTDYDAQCKQVGEDLAQSLGAELKPFGCEPILYFGYDYIKQKRWCDGGLRTAAPDAFTLKALEKIPLAQIQTAYHNAWRNKLLTEEIYVGKNTDTFTKSETEYNFDKGVMPVEALPDSVGGDMCGGDLKRSMALAEINFSSRIVRSKERGDPFRKRSDTKIFEVPMSPENAKRFMREGGIVDVLYQVANVDKSEFKHKQYGFPVLYQSVNTTIYGLVVRTERGGGDILGSLLVNDVDSAVIEAVIRH